MKAVTDEIVLRVNNDVIRILEETLEDAKKGHISDLAVSYVKVNGIACNNFSCGVNKACSLLGSVQITQRQILDKLVSVKDE